MKLEKKIGEIFVSKRLEIQKRERKNKNNLCE